jgi:putative FmdB family regulatory protein
MPVYNFNCQSCKKDYELSMKFEQHKIMKDILTCRECGSKLNQVVARLNFKLAGQGWHANEGTGYEITQTELNKNLDLEKRIEHTAHDMQEKDKQKSRVF